MTNTNIYTNPSQPGAGSAGLPAASSLTVPVVKAALSSFIPQTVIDAMGGPNTFQIVAAVSADGVRNIVIIAPNVQIEQAEYNNFYIRLSEKTDASGQRILVVESSFELLVPDHLTEGIANFAQANGYALIEGKVSIIAGLPEMRATPEQILSALHNNQGEEQTDPNLPVFTPVVAQPIASGAAVPLTPAAILYNKLTSIDTNGNPAWQALFPPEVVAALGAGNVEIEILGETRVALRSPEGSPYRFVYELKLTGDGKGLEIFSIYAQDTSLPGSQGFGAMDALVNGARQLGLEYISINTSNDYHNVYQYMNRYHFNMLPGATASMFLAVEAYLNTIPELQLPSQLPTAENAAEWETVMMRREAFIAEHQLWAGSFNVPLHLGLTSNPIITSQPVSAWNILAISQNIKAAVSDGRLALTGDAAQDVIDIGRFIADNPNIAYTNPTQASSPTSATTQITIDTQFPIQNIDLQPGQTISVRDNLSGHDYTIQTVSYSGQMVVFMSVDSATGGPMPQGTPVGIGNLFVQWQDNRMTLIHQSLMPPVAAVSHSAQGSSPLTILQPVLSTGPQSSQVVTGRVVEVNYGNYQYSLISDGQKISVYVESPAGEMIELGNLGGGDSRVGPFLAVNNEIYFFPYEITESGISVYSPTFQSANSTPPSASGDLRLETPSQQLGEGAYSELTFFGINQHAIKQGRSASWITVSLNLEYQGSEEFREYALQEVYKSLKEICRQNGIFAPVIVIEGNTLAVSIPSEFTDEMRDVLFVEINDSPLAEGIIYTYSGDVEASLDLETMVKVEIEVFDASSSPESLASLVPASTPSVHSNPLIDFPVENTGNHPVGAEMAFNMSNAWDIAFERFSINPIKAVVRDGYFTIVLSDGRELDALQLEKIQIAWEQAERLGLRPASVELYSNEFALLDTDGNALDIGTITFAQNGGLPPHMFSSKPPEFIRAMAAFDLRSALPELFAESADPFVFAEPEILPPPPWQGRDLASVLQESYLALLTPEVADYFKEEVASGRLNINIETPTSGEGPAYTITSSNYGTGEGKYSFTIQFIPTFDAEGRITELYISDRSFRDNQSPTGRGWGGTPDYYRGLLWIAQQMGIQNISLTAATPGLLGYFSNSLQEIEVLHTVNASVNQIIIPVPLVPLPMPSTLSIQNPIQEETATPAAAPINDLPIENPLGVEVNAGMMENITDDWDLAHQFGLEPQKVIVADGSYQIELAGGRMVDSTELKELLQNGGIVSNLAGLPPLDIYQAQRLAGNNFLPLFGYLMHNQEGIPTGTFTVYMNSEGRVVGHQQGSEVALVDDRGRVIDTISQEQAQNFSRVTIKINKTSFGDAELTYIESFELPAGTDPALAEMLRVSFDWNNGSMGNLLIVGFNTVNGHSGPASATLAAQMTEYLHSHQVQAVNGQSSVLPTGFEAELNQIRNIDPQLANLLEAHLRGISAEERAALGIDITDIREYAEYLAAVQNGEQPIENSSEYSQMNDLLNDLGINSEMEVFSQVTGRMFTLRLKARYGNEIAGIILSQVDFTDFSRGQFKTMMNAINKAYLGNNSAIGYLSNIYSAEQVMAIRTTLGNNEIRRFEQLAASGQPLNASQYEDFQNLNKQMQKPFNADLLATLGGQPRLDTLSTQVEAAQQVAQTPTAETPAAPTAPVSIVDIILKKFDLSETEVLQLIELLSRPGLTEEQFLNELVAMGLSLDMNTLKTTLNQALMDEMTARAAADPEFAAKMQEQFNMHGGRIGIGSIFSEIAQECGQEYAQGGILAILKTNSPLVQFLLEPVVEGEFWAAMAHGNFGVLKSFFGEMMPATSAGMVGAGIYNAILSVFGVSGESTARSLLPQITVGVMSTIGYSALVGAGTSSSAFIRVLSRLLSNPMTQRLFVALALSGPIASQMSSWMGYKEDFAVGATIAQQNHPTAYGVLSSLLGSEWATIIINDSNDILNYELQLADQAGQAEATGHNLIDALSALVLLYVVKNPPATNPELYTDYALQVNTDNPDFSDPKYYQNLLNFISQAMGSQSNLAFNPSLLAGVDPLASDDPTNPAVLPDFLSQNGPQLNQAELAYTMLVGIAQGQDISGQQAIYQALGLMDSDGQPIESNQYVQEGQQLFEERRQNEESGGLITQIEGFIAHEGEEALESVQVTNQRVDQARAADLVPGLDVNLPPELLGDSRGVVDAAALMHYVIGQNQGAIDDIAAQQQKVMAALDQVVRALSGEAVQLDFDDPTIQAVLNYLTHHLPAQS